MKIIRTSIVLTIALSLLVGSAAVLQVVGDDPAVRPQEQHSSLPESQPNPVVPQDANDDSCELPLAFASELEPALREADRADALETVEQAVKVAPVDEVCRIVEYILDLLRCDSDEECCPGNTLDCLLRSIERLIASAERWVDDLTRYRPIEMDGKVPLELPQVELDTVAQTTEADALASLVGFDGSVDAESVVQDAPVVAVPQHEEPVDADMVVDAGPALTDPTPVATEERMETQDDATLTVTV